MRAAVRVEWWKLRRSPVTLTATALIVVLLPAMGLGFYSVGTQGGTGAVAQKAAALLVGEGWEGYLGSVDQIAASAVFLGAGIAVAWMFGREHADRTFPSLFALPVSRAKLAAAKFVVLLAWVLVLTVLVVVVTAGLGFIANVGTFEAEAHLPGIARLFAVVLSASVLALVVALAASAGRGYLPGIAAVVLLLIAAQIAVLFGTGGWFPFAVPGLLAVAGADGAPTLNAVQVALVPFTAAAAAGATIRWWQDAPAV